MISDKDKIEALIGRAIDGGFRWPMVWASLLTMNYEVKILDGDEDIAFYGKDISPNPWTMSYEKLLYNKDFNKALFGEEHGCLGGYHRGGGYCRDYGHGFKHHMQQAVISDNPIDYLYQAVFGEEKKG